MDKNFILPSFNRIPPPSSIRIRIREWALVIIIVGAQLGIYLNTLVVNLDWNNILMPLAILLLPNWHNIFSLRLKSMSNLMLFLALLFMLMLFYLFFGRSSVYLTKLFLFSIAFLFSLASLGTKDLNFENVIKKVWIVSIICAILGLYLELSGQFYKMLSGNDKDIAHVLAYSKLCVGNGCCVGIASAICYPHKTKIMRWLIPISIIFEFIVILLIGKRTPLIAAIASLIALYVTTKNIKWSKTLVSSLGVILAIVLTIVLFDNSIHITDRFSHLIEYTQTGLYDAINGTTTSGNISAQYRYIYINRCLDYISQEFTWLNCLIGAGANKLSVSDVPILQSFVDMGIFGFLTYGFFIVLFPIYIIFSKSGKIKTILFATLLCMYGVVSCMNSGNPYDMVKWLPAILLVYTYSRYNHSKPTESQHKRL